MKKRMRYWRQLCARSNDSSQLERCSGWFPLSFLRERETEQPGSVWEFYAALSPARCVGKN